MNIRRTPKFWLAIAGALALLGGSVWAATHLESPLSPPSDARDATPATGVVRTADAPGAAVSQPSIARPRLVPHVDARPTMAAFEKDDPDGQRVDADIDRVIAWLEVTPGGVSALAAWIESQNGRYDEGAMWPRIGLAALGASRQPEARDALIALAEGKALSPALRLHAVMHLGASSGVGETEVAALTALAADRTPTPGARSNMVASGALSSLGALAREGRIADPVLRERVLSTVREALTAETDTAYLAAAVHGATASADASVLSALEPIASHADRDVRGALAAGLGGIPGGIDAPWAVTWARRESVAQVRASLARAAVERAAARRTAPSPEWTAWAVDALPSERGAAATGLIAIVGAAAAAGSEPARTALLARFTRERDLGRSADGAILRALGRHLDATTLGAAIAAGSRP